MRTLLLGGCEPQHTFVISDPDAPTEAEFELLVAKALTCSYPDYRCVPFVGGFRYDDRVHRPDLALVAEDYSHWFVVEVELVSHSLDRHVLPQVRAFRYGAPELDCASILARELNIEHGVAESLIEFVPRSVAVIANRRDERWEIALAAHTIQLLTVSSFVSPFGVQAVEVDGLLEVVAESLGFGCYSATDRSLRFPRSVKLPQGEIQVSDPEGPPSLWTVTASGDSVWVQKNVGTPDIDHDAHVQLIRSVDGRLSLRHPRRPGDMAYLL